MKTTKLAFASALILLGFVVSETALAQHRHRHHGGVALGFALGLPLGLAYAYRPYYPPYYASYYSPYYSPYYPPVASYAPPTYIEQSSPQAAPAPQSAQNYWYFCADSQSYYPYVNQCRGGWQRVSPTPPPG